MVKAFLCHQEIRMTTFALLFIITFVIVSTISNEGKNGGDNIRKKIKEDLN